MDTPVPNQTAVNVADLYTQYGEASIQFKIITARMQFLEQQIQILINQQQQGQR